MKKVKEILDKWLLELKGRMIIKLGGVRPETVNNLQKLYASENEVLKKRVAFLRAAVRANLVPVSVTLPWTEGQHWQSKKRENVPVPGDAKKQLLSEIAQAIEPHVKICSYDNVRVNNAMVMVWSGFEVELEKIEE